MKPTCFTFIVVFFCTHYLASQTKIDYFKNVVDTTSNVQLKLASIDSLIFLHKKANQLDISANYAEQFVQLAVDNKKYELGAEVAISIFHMINIRLGHRERALALIEKVEPFVDEMEDSYYKGGIYLKKGGGYSNGKNYQKATKYFSKAIELYSDRDSIYKADAFFF